MFAVPYFVYDIYAMFMCYWYKLQVKGHEEASAVPRHMSSALSSYLRREFLMVLHHVVMVTVCFPVSVVTVMRCSFGRAENQSGQIEGVQSTLLLRRQEVESIVCIRVAGLSVKILRA